MRAAWALLATLSLVRPAGAEGGGGRTAPIYSLSSIVNAASNLPGPLAPNTIVSIYGSDLAYATRAIAAGDILGGLMPSLLPGSGVRVYVSHLPAHIYYVSPRQVNVLLPATLAPGPAELQLTLDGRAGPAVPIRLERAAPALFVHNERYAVATRPDGSLITRDAPAAPGDDIVLYATGLGETIPPVGYGEIAKAAARLARLDEFSVLLDGVALPAGRIAYAGLTPGFAGLYQVNCKLPAVTGEVEVRLSAGDIASPPAIVLPILRNP